MEKPLICIIFAVLPLMNINKKTHYRDVEDLAPDIRDSAFAFKKW